MQPECLSGQTQQMVTRERGRFIEPRLLLKTDKLARTVDGYRAIALKSEDKIYLRSRNDKDFSQRYVQVVKGLRGLPGGGQRWPSFIQFAPELRLGERSDPVLHLRRLGGRVNTDSCIEQRVTDVRCTLGRVSV
jgi:hypothetical protein